MSDNPETTELLTAEQVGDLLKIHVATVRRMADRSAIPGAMKIGGQWRFDRLRLYLWLEEKKNEQ